MDKKSTSFFLAIVESLSFQTLCSSKGMIHLAGVIITLWGEIYPSKDKIKWAAFRTVAG